MVTRRRVSSDEDEHAYRSSCEGSSSSSTHAGTESLVLSQKSNDSDNVKLDSKNPLAFIKDQKK